MSHRSGFTLVGTVDRHCHCGGADRIVASRSSGFPGRGAEHAVQIQPAPDRDCDDPLPRLAGVSGVLFPEVAKLPKTLNPDGLPALYEVLAPYCEGKPRDLPLPVPTAWKATGRGWTATSSARGLSYEYPSIFFANPHPAGGARNTSRPTWQRGDLGGLRFRSLPRGPGRGWFAELCLPRRARRRDRPGGVVGLRGHGPVKIKKRLAKEPNDEQAIGRCGGCGRGSAGLGAAFAWAYWGGDYSDDPEGGGDREGTGPPVRGFRLDERGADAGSRRSAEGHGRGLVGRAEAGVVGAERVLRCSDDDEGPREEVGRVLGAQP